MGFPAHTTHLLQPLDVGVFGPIKFKFRSITASGALRSKHLAVNKARFPQVLNYAMQQVCTKKRVRESFRDSGLIPFDPLAIDRRNVQKSAKRRRYLTIAA